MDVFSNFYLMRDICGLNCKCDNLSCSKAELWDVLQLRIQSGQLVKSELFSSCAEKGNIVFMEWLTTNGVNGCTRDAMDWAAQKGHLEMVKWLSENRTEGCTHLGDEYGCGKWVFRDGEMAL